MNKNDLKRYLISSAITFSSAFLMSIALQINEMSVEALTGSVIIGIILTAFRYGIKALAELFILKNK